MERPYPPSSLFDLSELSDLGLIVINSSSVERFIDRHPYPEEVFSVATLIACSLA